MCAAVIRRESSPAADSPARDPCAGEDIDTSGMQARLEPVPITQLAAFVDKKARAFAAACEVGARSGRHPLCVHVLATDDRRRVWRRDGSGCRWHREAQVGPGRAAAPRHDAGGPEVCRGGGEARARAAETQRPRLASHPCLALHSLKTVVVTLWGAAADAVGAEIEALAGEGGVRNRGCAIRTCRHVAQSLKHPPCLSGEAPVVVVSSCRVSSYNGVSVSSLSRSVVLVNPAGGCGGPPAAGGDVLAWLCLPLCPHRSPRSQVCPRRTRCASGTTRAGAVP